MAKKLSEVWDARKKIFEGIKNDLFKKEDIEVIAQERLAICMKCDVIDKVGKTCFMPGSQPCCGKCGCKLAWKVRCLSEECDLFKWEAVLSPEEEDDMNKKLGIEPEH